MRCPGRSFYTNQTTRAVQPAKNVNTQMSSVGWFCAKLDQIAVAKLNIVFWEAMILEFATVIWSNFEQEHTDVNIKVIYIFWRTNYFAKIFWLKLNERIVDKHVYKQSIVPTSFFEKIWYISSENKCFCACARVFVSCIRTLKWREGGSESLCC